MQGLPHAREIPFRTGDVENHQTPRRAPSVTPRTNARPQSPAAPDPHNIIVLSSREKEKASTSSPPRLVERADPTGAIVNLTAPSILGLVQVRTGVDEVVLKKKNILQDALNTVSLSLREQKVRVAEEMGRANFVNQILAEKTDNHRRALQEYDRAREMLRSARVEASYETSQDRKDLGNSFLLICESLVNSGAEKVQTSQASLSIWEFKAQRQRAAVTQVNEELRTAEARVSETEAQIHADLAHLQAVCDLLQEL